jgi:hypothetical protein
MAHIVNRQVSIRWKLNPDSFALINKNILTASTHKIGSSIQGVTAMIIRNEMMGMLMPNIIALNENNDEFTSRVADYWNSLSVNIPDNGKDLEIGFSFSLNDIKRKDNLIEIQKEYKTIKTDKDLANVVLSHIPDDEQYKYGTPLKSEDYLLWIYCKNYRDVANTVNDINKSSHIRFYIHDEAILKQQKESLIDLRMSSQNKLFNIINNENADTIIYNMLCVLQPDSISLLDSKTSKERQIDLFDIMSSDPNKFNSIVDDKNLQTKALIQKLINKKILRKLPNTDIIVDGEDSSLIIGNTFNDAITWFALENNIPKISEYNVLLKNK